MNLTSFFEVDGVIIVIDGGTAIDYSNARNVQLRRCPKTRISASAHGRAREKETVQAENILTTQVGMFSAPSTFTCRRAAQSRWARPNRMSMCQWQG